MNPSPAKQALVKLEGELTIFNAREMADMLLAPFPASLGIEIDLSGVTEIDSAGLQVLIAAKRLADDRGTALTFTGHSPAVLEILDLTDLLGFFGAPALIKGSAA